MDEKISLHAVNQYSEAYATKMASLFFATKDKITGPQILSLCDVKQVNLFVLRELMKQWKTETEKLKSPFFNYDADEVAKSLKHFQNTLSNHILISRNDFLPLLKTAVSQTIYLILDPYDFYSDTLDQEGKSALSTADLKNDIKYLKINKAPLENLVQKLEAKNIASINGNEAFALLDTILEEVSFTPEDIEAYLDQFSRIVPLQLEKLYDTKPQTQPDIKPEVKPEPKAENKPRVAEPVVVTAPPAPVVVEKKVAAPYTAPVEKQSAGKNFQKVAQIKDSLTINQKFMFTKILFNGDFEIFSGALDRIDKLDNLSQAIKFLEADYPEWDKESEEYLEFLEMVQRRFA